MLQQHIKIQAYTSKELYTVSQIHSTLIASYDHFTDVKVGYIFIFCSTVQGVEIYIYAYVHIPKIAGYDQKLTLFRTKDHTNIRVRKQNIYRKTNK